jgi:shikimate kinase
LNAERIVLVGFMGSGKTSVGRLLASRLGYAFVDLDREVEELAGAPIPEIFRRQGEASFRDLERRATVRADGTVPAVVATGGGWMSRRELRDHWPDAVYVWLVVRPETVLHRVGEEVQRRPMLDPETPDRSIRWLLEAREPDYRQAAFAVQTDDRTVEEVVGRILELLATTAVHAGRAGSTDDDRQRKNHLPE